MSPSLFSSFQSLDVTLPKHFIQPDVTGSCQKFNQASFQFLHKLIEVGEHSPFQILGSVELTNCIYSKKQYKIPCFVAREIPLSRNRLSELYHCLDCLEKP